MGIDSVALSHHLLVQGLFLFVINHDQIGWQLRPSLAAREWPSIRGDQSRSEGDLLLVNCPTTLPRVPSNRLMLLENYAKAIFVAARESTFASTVVYCQSWWAARRNAEHGRKGGGLFHGAPRAPAIVRRCLNWSIRRPSPLGCPLKPSLVAAQSWKTSRTILPLARR